MSSLPLEHLAEELLTVLTSRFPVGYRPVLIWKNLRVSAGIAYFEKGAIALSRRLLLDEERLESTLVHEYAHLLAYHRHGRQGKGHGAPWKKAMQDLGAAPQVYHSYEVQRNRAKTLYTYRCKRCQVQFVRSRPVKALFRFRHRACGGSLEFLGAFKNEAGE